MSLLAEIRGRRTLPTLLAAGTLAAATLTIAQSVAAEPVPPAPAAAAATAPADVGTRTSLDRGELRLVSAAARTTAAPDRRKTKKASRAALRPSASPFRFATKKFNRWYAKRYMKLTHGWSRAQMRCLGPLWGKESAWNERAHNGSSGAHGIPQAMPGRKMAKYGSDWRTNPMTQIKWGLYYIKAVYGKPCSAWRFWQSRHWY